MDPSLAANNEQAITPVNATPLRRSTRARSSPQFLGHTTPPADKSENGGFDTTLRNGDPSEASLSDHTLSILPTESPNMLLAIPKRARSSDDNASCDSDTRDAKRARLKHDANLSDHSPDSETSEMASSPPDVRARRAEEEERDIARELSWYSELQGEPLRIVGSRDLPTRSMPMPDAAFDAGEGDGHDDDAVEGDDEADGHENKSTQAANGRGERKRESSSRFEREVNREIQKLALNVTRAVRKPNGNVDTLDVINWLVERQYGGTRWMGPAMQEGESYQQAMRRQFINSAEVRDAIEAEKLEDERRMLRRMNSRERFKPRSHYALEDTPTPSATETEGRSTPLDMSSPYDSCTSTAAAARSWTEEEEDTTS